jgi:ABC-type nitrate/sulfonate/bicarbonate transport system substrate-binding protein
MRGDAVEFHDPDAFMGYMMLATRRDWAAQHKDVVAAMLRALHKAEIYVANNPGESRAFLARVMDMDLKVVAKIWPYYEIKLRMNKPALLQAIQYVGENATITDPAFADKPLPNYDDYVDESFLPTSMK